MNSNEKEYRSAAGALNIKEEDDKLILEGYAVVFDTPTTIGQEERGKGYYEVIAKGAIDASALKDVPLKYNHDNGTLILARTRNGSLELKIDDKGLFIRAKLLPEVQTHRDVYTMVKNGLLDKMSFAFTVKDYIIDRSGSLPKKVITKIGKLYDVSVVDIPAYDDTEIHARSVESLEKELALLDSKEKQTSEDVELLKYKLKCKLNLM